VHIKYEDNAGGMPEEIRSRIFEPFYTTKDIGVGTGLGLSISHEIILQHRGVITVTSEVGKGTQFDISFPVPIFNENLIQNVKS
jgi:two-component system NtrC family sensor kinase